MAYKLSKYKSAECLCTHLDLASGWNPFTYSPQRGMLTCSSHLIDQAAALQGRLATAIARPPHPRASGTYDPYHPWGAQNYTHIYIYAYIHAWTNI